ncbi:MAG: tRNA lysidine(34) synthetase TilS [Reyranellaceae bacterium]
MPLTAAARRHAGRAPAGDVAPADRPPIAAAEFAAAMARLGPFEPSPDLAVAVSGGRDSLALALLADDWARERGGSVLALIVDHGLRAGSAAEAAQVASMLRDRGIETEILQWQATRPVTGISEAARAARYALLERRCSARGILHLLLGHQADDQAETILLRLADSSGPEGLAGMAAIVERPRLRLLRPLLGFARARLAATVSARGLRWIDDPSNERLDFARIRARRALAVETAAGLLESGAHFAALRDAIERRLAAIAVDCVTADPRGFAWLSTSPFLALPQSLALRLLGRLAAIYGGRHYPPRRAGLVRALAGLAVGRNAVAGGCRFLPRGGRILVCREAGAVAASDAGSGPLLWDNRYAIDLPQAGRLGALGEAGRQIALRHGTEMLRLMPAPVAAALPALHCDAVPVAVFLPGLAGQMAAIGGSGSGGRAVAAPASLIFRPADFRPAHSLATAPWVGNP